MCKQWLQHRKRLQGGRGSGGKGSGGRSPGRGSPGGAPVQVCLLGGSSTSRRRSGNRHHARVFEGVAKSQFSLQSSTFQRSTAPILALKKRSKPSIQSSVAVALPLVREKGFAPSPRIPHDWIMLNIRFRYVQKKKRVADIRISSGSWHVQKRDAGLIYVYHQAAGGNWIILNIRFRYVQKKTHV